MKVLVIEMTRTLERRLPSGDSHTLQEGKRYTMSDDDAAPLLRPTKKFVKHNGAVVEKEVPPAAKVVTETDVPGEEAQAKLAAEKATARTRHAEKTYFEEASLSESIRDAEAEANAPTKVVAAPSAVTEAAPAAEETGE